MYKRRERYCRNLWKIISEEEFGGKEGARKNWRRGRVKVAGGKGGSPLWFMEGMYKWLMEIRVKKGTVDKK